MFLPILLCGFRSLLVPSKILNFARTVKRNEAKWPEIARFIGFADILDIGCAENRCFKYR